MPAPEPPPDLPSFDLTGRGVGVSGGGGHLGRSIALALAAHGATAVIFGRHAGPLDAVVSEAEGRRLPGRVVAMVADVSDDEQIERVLDRIESEAGSVRGWVNNAFGGDTGRFLELSRPEVDAVLARGTTDVLMATQLALRRMVPHSRGAVVNVASMYGMVSPQPDAYVEHPKLHNPPAYGAAKAAVIQFTRYAACHIGEFGIRVNSVSPGPFPGPTAAGHADFVLELVKRVPLRRVGMPVHVAGAVVFLVADASEFVTGHNLVVDGGWTAW